MKIKESIIGQLEGLVPLYIMNVSVLPWHVSEHTKRMQISVTCPNSVDAVFPGSAFRFACHLLGSWAWVNLSVSMNEALQQIPSVTLFIPCYFHDWNLPCQLVNAPTRASPFINLSIYTSVLNLKIHGRSFISCRFQQLLRRVWILSSSKSLKYTRIFYHTKFDTGDAHYADIRTDPRSFKLLLDGLALAEPGEHQWATFRKAEYQIARSKVPENISTSGTFLNPKLEETSWLPFQMKTLL